MTTTGTRDRLSASRRAANYCSRIKMFRQIAKDFSPKLENVEVDNTINVGSIFQIVMLIVIILNCLFLFT